jgi:hypothetical protein
MRYDLALALLAVFIGTDVRAQAPSPATSEAFKAMIGKWEMSNADRDRTCVITFRADPAGTAFKLEMDRGCPGQMPEVKDVVAWTIGGLDLVRLLDGKGKPVMEFTEVESGTYEAQRPGEGVFFMQSAAVAAGPVGVWTVHLVHGPRRTGAQIRERPVLALRGKRSDQLVTRPGGA